MSESTAKADVTIATVVTAGGASGMTFHQFLETGQLVLSIAATLVGLLYLLWKWYREWRLSKRRNRREGD